MRPSTIRPARRQLCAIVLIAGLAVACTAGSSVTPTSTPNPAPSSTASPSSVGGSSPSGSAGPQSGSQSGSTSGSTTATNSEPAPPSEASLAIGFILEPESLDCSETNGAAISQVVLTNIYETLVKLDQGGKIVPALADKWTVSPDGRTYTFTLHPGVKFSSGADFTADDAKFSLDRVQTGWKAPVAAEMSVVASTTVGSPTELTVTLKQPSNSWLFNMTGRVGAMFSRTGIADLPNKPVGTGPYTLQKWNRGSSIILQRNDSYWGTKASVKTVTFKYFKSDATAMNNALLTNGIQVVSTVQSPETLGQFKNNDRYQIIQGATDGEVMMTLNDGKAPLSDVRVRQAINYAVDKKAILKTAWSGYGTVIGSHESPNDPWYVDEANRYPHDVAKAKQLLAAAGRPNLTLNLALPPVQYATAAAPVIISELSEAGITVKASNVTFPVWLDQVFAKADYDMTIINHVEPRDLATLWGDPKYYTRYNNPAVQKLLTGGDAASPTDFVADYKKVVELLADDAAAAWLWSFPNLLVADVNVKGLPRNAVGESFVLSDLSVS